MCINLNVDAKEQHNHQTQMKQRSPDRSESFKTLIYSVAWIITKNTGGTNQMEKQISYTRKEALEIPFHVSPLE